MIGLIAIYSAFFVPGLVLSSVAPVSSIPPKAELARDDVIARIIWAQKIAKGRGPLPFKLSCTDEQKSDACRDGGRAALASLPLEQIRSIQPIYNTSCVRVVFEYFGDVCPAAVKTAPRTVDAYEIRLPHAGGGGYTWTIGLAPASGVETIILERGMVFYH